jgi:hypothetical protein
MEMKLTSSMSWSDLVRNAIAGAIAILAFAGMQHDFASLGAALNEKSGLLFVGISLAIGTVIYSVHRALLYPLIVQLGGYMFHAYSYLMGEMINNVTIQDPPLAQLLRVMPTRWNYDNLPPLNSVDDDLKRWARSLHKKSVQKCLSGWADQVHLLFCTTWAVLLAVGANTSKGTGTCISPAFSSICLILVACFIFAAGTVPQIRYRVRERAVMDKEGLDVVKLAKTTPETTPSV